MTDEDFAKAIKSISKRTRELTDKEQNITLDDENDFQFVSILNEIRNKVYNLEDKVTIGQGLKRTTYVELGDVIDIIEEYLPEGEEL